MLDKTDETKQLNTLTDPVCGMDVTKDSEHHIQYAEHDYYFCSSNCFDKFEADPEQYRNKDVDDQLKDPVCGMDVTSDSEYHLKHKDHDYYFCSEHCETKFKTSPDTYLHPVPVVDDSCPDGSCSLTPVSTSTYTCPMHPEIEQEGAGECPKCGMALEPKDIIVGEEGPNPELVDFRKRFIVGAVLSIPLLILAMGGFVGLPIESWIGKATSHWIELVLATPVVLWSGWPFFVRGWKSIQTMNLNMFTLIAIGTGTAFLYSVVATLMPSIFPDAFRAADGSVAVYFEAAAVIIALIFLGQIMEL
jgi:Cu+-exporting ATPase